MHLLQPIGYLTRRLQRVFPQRPLRGISRLGNFLKKTLPDFEGPVTMNPGFQVQLYSRQGVEMDLLLSGVYHPALSFVLSQYATVGGYYLDMGANLGFFSLMFAKWAGKSGKVVAFEPNPQMVARIQDGNQRNGFHIDIVEKAVHGSSGETIVFYVSASPRKSSIYSNHVPDIVQQISVETITIDTYVEQAQWTRVDVIKLDIEGNDCRALVGGSRTIWQYKPFIVFEYWRDTPQDAKQQAAALLSDTGYRLEMLHLNGKRQPFDWDIPDSLHHVDVLCFPPAARG